MGKVINPMRYISTRGRNVAKRFSEILLEGLAPDGGLYMPWYYPRVNKPTLGRWRNLSYRDLAFEILSLYIDDIPAKDLRDIVYRTYTKEIFGTEEITPVKKLMPGIFLQDLSTGPTLAFKDVALQLLGNLFEYELARRGEELNILGATSGDTGSAAEYAMLGKKGIKVFMLSPNGRMSPFQTAQMYSLNDPNIYNIAITGSFDDCQDIVKAISKDADFKAKYKIGTVNSINWARILAQVVYYFYGYFQLEKQEIVEKVNFAVPSGNFGNICAGHVARMMGLPIDHLILATNENDVLDEFFRTGHYRVRSHTVETSSPSMDICKASNFERFMFDSLNRDSSKVNELFTRSDGFKLSDREFSDTFRYGFVSGQSNQSDCLFAIRKIWRLSKVIIDTHTACAVQVAFQYDADSFRPTIIFETAKATKFPDAVFDAIEIAPECPEKLKGIEQMPKYFTEMVPSDVLVKEFIRTHC